MRSETQIYAANRPVLIQNEIVGPADAICWPHLELSNQKVCE